MHKTILAFVFLAVVCGSARAGVVLTTSNAPGTPLLMSAGTTSGPMLVSVTSDNFPNDLMSAWQISLVVVADAGATGAVTFQDPGAGTFPPPPPSYVFGSDGLGIAVPTNTGTLLSANDFNVGTGSSVVPAAPGANLLQIDFLATSNASGLFGIYALEGIANTQWTDGDANQQFFTNVPEGTGMVRIGEVLITQSVPEPSSLILLALGLATLAVTRAPAAPS